MKCRHDWLYVGKCSDWKDEESKKCWLALKEKEEKDFAKWLSIVNKRNWFQICFYPAPYLARETSHLFRDWYRKFGSQYQCANCNQIKEVYGM